MSLDLEKEGRLREEINMLKNADKTMDKIVALCKNRGFILPAQKSTADWPTPGITAPWVWN